MEPNCQNQPCHELTELQKRFTRFQDDTVKRLAAALPGGNRRVAQSLFRR